MRGTVIRLSLLGLFLLASPLLVAAQAAAAPDVAPANLEPKPTAFEVEEYREDFQVSEEEARAVLQAQSDGTGIVELLRRALGDAYAGVWFDHEAAEFVIPTLPEADRGALRAALAAMGLNAYRLQPAQLSWADLLQRQKAVLASPRAWARGADRIRTSVDPRRNAVVVQTAADLGGLRKEEVACRTFNPRVCDAPLRGGVGIGAKWPVGGGELGSFPLCTAGFKAHGLQFGDRFMLTAGHCAPKAPAGATWYSENVAGAERAIGPFAGYVHDERGDFGQIRANGSAWDSPSWQSSAPKVAHYWGNQEYPIYYEAWSYPGQYVCVSGTVSGTSCANVQQIRLQYPGEPPQGELLGACVRLGDSGGPVFDYGSNTAVGLITEVEVGPPACQGRSYYQEIIDATSMMGVTVGTRVGGPPTAATGGATSVQSDRVTVNGTVNANQVATKYRFQFGATTAYGRVAPVPDGDAGHGGAVPVSVTFDGLLPNATYNYRLVAQSPAGTSNGANAQVTTKAVPPLVTTKPPTNVSGTGATFNATVDPEGAATTYFFEYGTSSGFGSKTAEVSAGAGRNPVSVSLPVSGLEFGATYHVRAVAKSIGGTAVGASTTFTPGWRKTTEVPLPAGMQPPVAYSSVECLSAGWCISVGAASGAAPEPLQSFASTYDGAKWTSVKIPQVLGIETNYLTDVACVSTQDCWAVGLASGASTGGAAAAVAHWNGTSWQTSVLPKPPGAAYVQLMSVACPAGNSCFAVGFFQTAAGARNEVIARWDGTSWTYLPPPPHPEGSTYVTMTDVACGSATNCYASGFYLAGSTQTVFANRWNGSAWSREPVFSYSGGGLTRLQVGNCVPGTSICVKGGVTSSGGRNVPMFAKTAGAGWSLTPLPGVLDPTDKSSAFPALECATETACVGVGYVENGQGQLLPLAGRLRPDGTWERQTLPALAPGRATLSGISCHSATYCMAVGTANGHPNTSPLAALYAK